MTKYIPLLLMSTFVFCQTIKEDLEFYDNGQSRVQIYKNMDLETVKRNTFDAKGKLLSSFNYDPETGLKDGEFVEGPNKGFFEQGEINCNDCVISLNGLTFKGNFKKGRPFGNVEVSQYTEKVSYSEDPTTSYLLSTYNKRPMVYFSSYGTGIYELQKRIKLNYNDNGFLEGKQEINDLTTLTFQNGVMTEILVLNEENKSIAKDSINRDQKIWKIDNKYYKNNGFIGPLYWSESSPFTIVGRGYDEIEPSPFHNEDFGDGGGHNYDEFTYFGGPVSVTDDRYPVIGIDYFSPTYLDESGIYIVSVGKTNIWNNSDELKRDFIYFLREMARHYDYGNGKFKINQNFMTPDKLKKIGLNPLKTKIDYGFSEESTGFIYSWKQAESIVLESINKKKFSISDVSINTTQMFKGYSDEQLKELGLTKHSYFSLSLSRSELPNYRFSYETIKNSQELIDLVEFFNNQPEDPKIAIREKNLTFIKDNFLDYIEKFISGQSGTRSEHDGQDLYHYLKEVKTIKLGSISGSMAVLYGGSSVHYFNPDKNEFLDSNMVFSSIGERKEYNYFGIVTDEFNSTELGIDEIIKEIEQKEIEEKKRIAELKKKLEIEIENADLNFITQRYIDFSGDLVTLKSINSTSYIKQWSANISGSKYFQTIFFEPTQIYYSSTEYDGNNQEVIADLIKKKGKYFVNEKKQSKLDKLYISTLIKNATLYPEINTNQLTYQGTEEMTIIEPIDNVEDFSTVIEKVYKLIYGNKIMYYSTKDFRKVIEIDNSANESTRTHFYDYKMINNVKTYTKMRIEKENNIMWFELEKFEINPTKPENASL